MRRPNSWGWWCSRRSDGTLNRGLVCVARIRSYTDLKDPDAHVLDGWVPATRKRCTKHAPSPKSECDHLNGGKSKVVIKIKIKNHQNKPTWWTKTSVPPSLGIRNPQPLATLNHFTAPRRSYCPPWTPSPPPPATHSHKANQSFTKSIN
jgi:hypothetical protein